MGVIPDEDTLKTIEKAIADAIFRFIDPDSTYVVILPGEATKFTTSRLIANKRVRLVGHRDDREGRIIRDYGIYRITTDDEPGHNEVTQAIAVVLFSEGTAIMRDGAELTVADVWSAAKMEVLARIDTEN